MQVHVTPEEQDSISVYALCRRWVQNYPLLSSAAPPPAAPPSDVSLCVGSECWPSLFACCFGWLHVCPRAWLSCGQVLSMMSAACG